MVYLDYTAATPVDPAVLQSMMPYYSERFFNPSALYESARTVRKDIDNARRNVAQVLGSKPSEVYFTAGGSEANNLAIRGVMENARGKKALISAVEHESIRRMMDVFKIEIIPVDSRGCVDLGALANMLDDTVALVSIAYANNEVGVVQDLPKISNVLKEARRRTGEGVIFHTDASQAANYFTVDVNRLGVDLMTLNGGKLYGPKQSGCLYVKHGVVLSPQVYGGGQENGLRSGTENVPQVIGFAEALTLAQKSAKDENSRLMNVRKILVRDIESMGGVVYGSSKHTLPNLVLASFDGVDNERLVMELDEDGYIVANGSACKAGSDDVSQSLLALGISESEIRSSIRISMGRQTTEEEIRRFVGVLRTKVSFQN